MTAPSPSDRARSMIGKVVHYESTKPSRNGEGTVLDVEFAGCQITRSNGDTWPGIRFKIKPLPGHLPKRAFWTHAMPDCPPEGPR